MRAWIRWQHRDEGQDVGTARKGRLNRTRGLMSWVCQVVGVLEKEKQDKRFGTQVKGSRWYQMDHSATLSAQVEKKVYVIQSCVFSSYNTNAMKLYQPLINCKITTDFAISAPGRFTGEAGMRMGRNSRTASCGGKRPGLQDIVRLVLGKLEGCLVARRQCCPHGSPGFPAVPDASY